MYLLYADESGTANSSHEPFFVLAGFSIFERQTHWLDRELTKIANRFDNKHFKDQVCELHGNPMFSGTDGWRQAASVPERVQAVVDILKLLNNGHSKINIIASVIEKSQIADPSLILPTAFEDIAFCFDRSLRNIYSRYNNPQRGIILFDNSSVEQKIQALSHSAKHIGKDNDKLRNFAEVPVFIDSKASRLIQLADIIAYWIYRYYNSQDNRGFNLIEPFILNDGKQRIGLIEHITDQTRLTLQQNSSDLGYPFPQ